MRCPLTAAQAGFSYFAMVGTGLLLGLTTSDGADWAQWRGEGRRGHSPDKGLLEKWPEGGPKQLWLFEDCGKGYSAPAVVDSSVYILGAREVTQLICLEEATGKEKWATEVGVIYKNDWGDGPRSTPTVDDGLVYALGGKGDLVCAKADRGEVVWSKSLTKDFGGKLPNWGYTESVLIDGEKLICTPGGNPGAIVALNKKTGDVIWTSAGLTDGAQYSSPIMIEHDGQRQYVQLFMKALVGVSAEDGKVLWKTRFRGRTAVVPTPIYSNGLIYVTAGYGAGCKQIRLGGQTPEITYENENIVNHHGGVILLDGHLYGHSDKRGDGEWVCQHFESGEIVWKSKKLGKGAIGYADGRFYCLGEKDGTVALIEASKDGWKEQGRFEMEPKTKIRSGRGKIWTHPVIVNGRLYLRDQDLFFSYDVKGE
jgi:outer membrane protein assembly factor BamB